jgi:hypothetical protein
VRRRTITGDTRGHLALSAETHPKPIFGPCLRRCGRLDYFVLGRWARRDLNGQCLDAHTTFFEIFLYF